MQRLDLSLETTTEPMRDIALYPHGDWFMEGADLVQRVWRTETADTLRKGPTLRVGMNLRIGSQVCHVKGVKYSIEEDGVVYRYCLGIGRQSRRRWFPIGLVRSLSV